MCRVICWQCFFFYGLIIWFNQIAEKFGFWFFQIIDVEIFKDNFCLPQPHSQFYQCVIWKKLFELLVWIVRKSYCLLF